MYFEVLSRHGVPTHWIRLNLFFRYSTKLPDSDGETSWLKEDTVRLQTVGNSIGPKFAIPCYN